MKASRADVAAVLAFRRQLALDHHLGRDAGVVGAGQPQRDKAAHAMPADDDVHLRLVEHVAHVQAAGHIGRRQDQREYRLLLVRQAGCSTWNSFSRTQYSAQRGSITPGS